VITTNSNIIELEQELTTRSMNILKANGINTVGLLLNLTKNDLLRMPNMGRKSTLEIEEVLLNYGMGLKPSNVEEQDRLRKLARQLFVESEAIRDIMEDLRKKHTRKMNEIANVQKMIEGFL
jgi:hypothetical protein